MGRFMSPDWSAKEEPVPYATMGDPQSLNLYAYVRNNPLSRADADGMEEMWIQYRAFIPPAQVGVGAAGGRGGNRTFSSQENGRSSVSLRMLIETDSAENGGNPLPGVTTGINRPSTTERQRSSRPCTVNRADGDSPSDLQRK